MTLTKKLTRDLFWIDAVIRENGYVMLKLVTADDHIVWINELMPVGKAVISKLRPYEIITKIEIVLAGEWELVGTMTQVFIPRSLVSLNRLGE